MNIADSKTLHECTSCQVCAAVCPKDAISISLNEDGFYRPSVNEKRCIDCSLCVKVCYKYDDQLKMSSGEDLGKTQLYAAWAKSDNLVKNTTSGGIGDLLARELIKEGYKVVGVAYNDDKVRAEHRIANTLDETLPFRGSKYIQSYTFDAMKEVVLKGKSEKYAVFGTPCQIYALNRWAERRKIRDNFFFVDLYCHGCPSLHIWTKYQQHIKERLGLNHFDKVEFRSKVKGWGNFYVVVVVDGRPVFVSHPNDDGFYELFFSDQVLNDGCRDCQLRSTHEYTDIRLGDFWGKKYLDNHRGVSAVSLVTDRAKAVFSNIQQEVDSHISNFADFLPYQSWGKSYHPNLAARRAILDSLRKPDESIFDAVRAYRKHQTVKGTAMRLLKHVLYYCPQGVTTFLKKIK